MDLTASIKQLETVIEAKIKGLIDNAQADVNAAVDEVETLLDLGKSLHAADGVQAAAAPEPAAEAPAASTTALAPEAPADPVPAPATEPDPATYAGTATSETATA